MELKIKSVYRKKPLHVFFNTFLIPERIFTKQERTVTIIKDSHLIKHGIFILGCPTFTKYLETRKFEKKEFLGNKGKVCWWDST